MAQNGSLGAFFVIVLGSSWGPRRQALKMAQNGSGSFFRNCFVLFFLGSPQSGPENCSEWLPGSLFCNCFGFFLGPPPARPRRWLRKAPLECVFFASDGKMDSVAIYGNPAILDCLRAFGRQILSLFMVIPRSWTVFVQAWKSVFVTLVAWSHHFVVISCSIV